MYNRVILMGRLTADPELKQSQSGVATCRFSIAVDRGYAKQGEERQTDFFNVTCFRQTAEFVSRYFSKGRTIHVEGKLQNNNYTDQNGVKHYGTNIIVDSVSFCGDKSNNQNQQGGGYYQPQGQQAYQPPAQQPYQPQAQTYAPPPQTPYSGAQTAQQRPPQYQQYAQPTPPPPQYQQPAYPQQAPPPSISAENDLSEFEEILGDGAVPF